MVQFIRTLTMTAAAAAAILAAAVPAVSEGPCLIRQATLHGVDGPVYYSVIDRGYRPLASPGSFQRADGAGLRQVAGID